MRRPFAVFVISAALACSNSPTSAPIIKLTAPTEGQHVLGGTSFAIQGTATGRGASEVTVTLNGGAGPQVPIVSGAFLVTVTLADGDNTVEVTATGVGGKGSSGLVHFRRAIPPTVQITGPTEGQRFVGSRSITVQGTVAGDGVSAATVKLNGGAGTQVTLSSGAFTTGVTLADQANTIEVTVQGENGSASSGVHVLFPYLALTTFQNASLVLGQADFTGAAANRSGSVAGDTIKYPYGDAAWDGAHLYLPDYGNSRVLVYDGFPGTNGAGASYVLGQPTLTASSGGTTASWFNGAETVRAAGGKLFVDDYGNSRVVIFSAIPTTSGAAADVAVGQPDLTSSGTACTSTRLNYPESIFVIGTKLIVADSSNNRVMIWNTIPTASGTAADVVLGQKDFTHCVKNDEAGSGISGLSPSAKTMFYPTDAWSDGTRLFVADEYNQRVLVWNTFPTSNQAAADLVLGQANFTTATAATTAAGMAYPYFLASNGNQLFVSDNNNSRILVWSSLPTTSSVPADVVFGQADFTHGTENDDNQNNMVDASPTARTLNSPSGVTALDDALIVSDEGNNRYLVYR